MARRRAHLRPVFLGDDLFACQPIAAAVQQAGGNFIFTCKPASHRTITEYLNGAELGRTPPDHCYTRQANDNDLPLALRRADACHR